jgi:hypothetical protein
MPAAAMLGDKIHLLAQSKRPGGLRDGIVMSTDHIISGSANSAWNRGEHVCYLLAVVLIILLAHRKAGALKH